MNFITVSNNIITGLFYGDIDADLSNTEYEGHEKIAIVNDTLVTVGEPVTFYDGNYERKPDVELIKEGLIKMQEGYIIKDNVLTEIDKKQYIVNGELLTGYELPSGAELYNEDEWYIDDDGKYLKKDDKYNLLMRKQEILRELEMVDAMVTTRTLREAALGKEKAITRLKEAEELAAKLRSELAILG